MHATFVKELLDTETLAPPAYSVLQAASLADVEVLLEQYQPGYAVVDLKLKGEASGLACVQTLHAADEEMLIVVLTGFASIATAVEAVKLGACHYLAKPSNTDDIEAAFGLREGNAEVELTNRSSSIKTLEWEHLCMTSFHFLKIATMI